MVSGALAAVEADALPAAGAWHRWEKCVKMRPVGCVIYGCCLAAICFFLSCDEKCGWI